MIPINQILTGNAADALLWLPDNCIDLIVTSPPYHQAVDGYQEYLDGLMAVFGECARTLRPNGKMCINAPLMPLPSGSLKQHTRPLRDIAGDIKHRILSETDLLLMSVYIWRKQTSKSMDGAYPYPGNNLENNTIEFIHVFVKPGKPPRFEEWIKEGRKLSLSEHRDLRNQIINIRPADTSRKGQHLAPFPEKLPARSIAYYTFGAVGDFPGEIVLDPYVGTGTTCVVAKRMRRRWMGIDNNSQFVEMARRRVDAAVVGDKPFLLAGDGKWLSDEELKAMPEATVRAPGEKGRRKHKRKTFGRNNAGGVSTQLPPPEAAE
jgi:modification methylase